MLTSSSTGGPASSNDYLIPLANPRQGADGGGGPGGGSTTELSGSGNRRHHQEQCGYWETSFTREGVKAIARGEPVLDSTSANGGHAGSVSLGDLRSNGDPNRRRSAKNDSKVTGDASTALSQSQSSQPLLDTPPDSPAAEGEAAAAVPPPPPDLLLNQTLDAANLCRKSYANVRILPGEGNSTASPPSRQPPTKSERSSKLDEINC